MSESETNWAKFDKEHEPQLFVLRKITEFTAEVADSLSKTSDSALEAYGPGTDPKIIETLRRLGKMVEGYDRKQSEKV